MTEPVVWFSAITTALLGIITFAALYFTIVQNRKLLEQNEKNLEHNEKTLTKMGLQNRPLLSVKGVSYHGLEPPTIDVINTGEKGAIIISCRLIANLEKCLIIGDKKELSQVIRKDQQHGITMKIEEWKMMEPVDTGRTQPIKRVSLRVLYKHEDDENKSDASHYVLEHFEQPEGDIESVLLNLIRYWDGNFT